MMPAGNDRILTTGQICDPILPSDLPSLVNNSLFHVGVVAGVAEEILPETLARMTEICCCTVVDIQVRFCHCFPFVSVYRLP